LKFTKYGSKEKILAILLAFVILFGSAITTTLAYGLPQQGNNYKNIGALGSFPSVEARQTENTIIGSNTTITSTNNNNTKEITLVAEDAEIEIAPGKRVKTWTFNGTVPAPTLRFTEGDNVTIHFINKSPIPHTIHFHGNHDDKNDGVVPQILPNQTYTYHITAQPDGALMYHCHAPPTTLHIRMGMYGALIVDPKDKTLLEPAKEFVMVMGEFNTKDQMAFGADNYLINGYADHYMHNPLEINHGDLLRLYLINLGTTIPYSFHLHSTTFRTYPSGLIDNEPLHMQTVSIAPGDASIVEAKWKYPGTYLFHSHGIQEERGNMGQINVVLQNDTSDKNLSIGDGVSTIADTISNSNGSLSLSSQEGKSISMFDWQYDLQKKLQEPTVINYTEQKQGEKSKDALMESKQTQESGEDLSLEMDKTLATNITTSTSSTADANNNTENNPNASSQNISIVPGSGSPNSDLFYEPSPARIAVGSTVTWTNDDMLPHTVTSGNPEKGPNGMFDSGVMNADKSFTYTFDKAGVLEYYCAIHPWMISKVMVQ
jgi:FtsP/CotA-like multicopper oxidase with cupredoxin domain